MELAKKNEQITKEKAKKKQGKCKGKPKGFRWSWEKNYLFMREKSGGALCLLCCTILESEVKIIAKHYHKNHADAHASIPGYARGSLVAKLKGEVAKAVAGNNLCKQSAESILDSERNALVAKLKKIVANAGAGNNQFQQSARSVPRNKRNAPVAILKKQVANAGAGNNLCKQSAESILDSERNALVAKLKKIVANAGAGNKQFEQSAGTSHKASVQASNNVPLNYVNGAEASFPSKEEKCRSVNLPTETMPGHVLNLGADLKGQLKRLCSDFVCFSLAVGENVNDSVQLAIFIRGVTEEFVITEELLTVVLLQDITTTDNVFIAVMKVLDDMGLKLAKLCSVVTDGGNGFGFADKMSEKVLLERLPPITVINSILHPALLCAETCTNFQSILNVVTKCFHFCKKQGFINYKFEEFLQDCDSQCPDVSFHCDTRLSSCAKLFQTAFALRKDIVIFMEMKGLKEPVMSDDQWVANLAFVNDMIYYLSELNASMQGHDHLISCMWDRVRGFKLELMWLRKQLLERNLDEFPSLASLDLPKDYDFSEFAESICSLVAEFDRRFKELEDMEMVIFMTPFFVPYDDAPVKFQRELIRLQCNTVLKDRYYASRNLLDFYKFLPKEGFPRLHAMAARFISMFGSTCVGEKIFSVMNLDRCKLGSRTPYEMLDAVLRTHSAQSVSPIMDALVDSKGCQASSNKTESVI